MALSTFVESTNRVIALVDMDCFYVQVEERDDPSIKGTPAAVVQYKTYKGGGIIAVNYEARAKGVSRQMRGDDAQAACPEIKLVRVPETRGKADLTKYRDAGREVIQVLTEFSSCVERASIDEAYIDLTEAVENRLSEISSNSELDLASYLPPLNMDCLVGSFVLGYDSTETWLESLRESEIPQLDDIKLAIGAEIVGKMREAVYKKTSFRCSAGIAHNKVLAKLVCGINKPNKQTVLPHRSVPQLWSSTKVSKVRGLGGKLGDYLIGSLGVENMCDLGKFTEKELSSQLGAKTGMWLYRLSQGYDDETVTPRQLPKSIGCNKNFFGPEALKTKEKVKFWITQLAAEVVERIQRDLEMNNRRAKSLTLHVKFEDQNPLSRTCGVNPQYNPERIAGDAYSIMEKLYQTLGVLPINSLGLIASKFEDEIDTSSYTKINAFFKTKPTSSSNIPDAAVVGVENDDSSNSEKNLDSSSLPPIAVTKRVAQDALDKLNESNKKPSTGDVNIPSANSVESELVNQIPTTPSTTSSKLAESFTNNNLTPKKSDTNESKEQRKPFFSFSVTAPPTSPRKSPRKLVTAAVRNEEGPSKRAEIAQVVGEEECERCGKKFSSREMKVHKDYHAAKDLYREINDLPPLDFDLRPETLRKKEIEASALERAARAAQKRPRGRGKGSASSSKRGKPMKLPTAAVPSSSSSAQSQSRTIDSYFGPKS
ncbi:unnamed protein product [Orchesella dallaii]|uniref:DNA polymerase eta n=1 Tax=Orchesella dallaii TaxID=48710 RepID=A0ABP1R896_9HEXA